MVRDYDPLNEFVVVLLKPDERISTYRICVFPLDNLDSETRDETPGQRDESPDLETLMQWEMEGGCEAACPHGCWVEPDGSCRHGNPSWLLKLGFI